jgi:hypothetical protein
MMLMMRGYARRIACIIRGKNCWIPSCKDKMKCPYIQEGLRFRKQYLSRCPVADEAKKL